MALAKVSLAGIVIRIMIFLAESTTVLKLYKLVLEEVEDSFGRMTEVKRLSENE